MLQLLDTRQANSPTKFERHQCCELPGLLHSQEWTWLPIVAAAHHQIVQTERRPPLMAKRAPRPCDVHPGPPKQPVGERSPPPGFDRCNSLQGCAALQLLTERQSVHQLQPLLRRCSVRASVDQATTVERRGPKRFSRPKTPLQFPFESSLNAAVSTTTSQFCTALSSSGPLHSIKTSSRKFPNLILTYCPP